MDGRVRLTSDEARLKVTGCTSTLERDREGSCFLKVAYWGWNSGVFDMVESLEWEYCALDW